MSKKKLQNQYTCSKLFGLNGNNSCWKLICVNKVFKADLNIYTWSGSISAVILTGAGGEMSWNQKTTKAHILLFH